MGKHKAQNQQKVRNSLSQARSELSMKRARSALTIGSKIAYAIRCYGCCWEASRETPRFQTEVERTVPKAKDKGESTRRVVGRIELKAAKLRIRPDLEGVINNTGNTTRRITSSECPISGNTRGLNRSRCQGEAALAAG